MQKDSIQWFYSFCVLTCYYDLNYLNQKKEGKNAKNVVKGGPTTGSNDKLQQIYVKGCPLTHKRLLWQKVVQAESVNIKDGQVHEAQLLRGLS